jgi:multiple sugar transport system substrate-binding protein
VVLALWAAAACGPAGPPAARTTGTTTITWYASSIDLRQNDFRRILVDAFESAHPEIRVDITSGPTDTDVNRAKLVDLLRSGAGAPDVYLGDVIWPAEFGQDNLAMPLDDVFGPDFWKRFEPTLLAAATYRGKVYAAPLFADQGMLFWRTDLFPTPPRTWEELVTDADQARRQGRVTYGYLWQGAAYEGLTCDWTEVLADAGGSALDASYSRSELGSPAALRALRFLQGLVVNGTSPAEVARFEEPDATQLFVSGQAAFLRGWNETLGRMTTPGDSAVYGKVGVAPLPTFAGQSGPGYSTVGGWDLYVNPRTQHLDAVRTFLDWMTDLQAQRILGRLAQIPTNVRVRAEQAVAGNPAVVAGLQARPVARPANTPAYPSVSAIIYQEINAAISGRQSPEAALRAADQRVDQVLR